MSTRRDELIADISTRIRRVMPGATDAEFRALVLQMAVVALKYEGDRPWEATDGSGACPRDPLPPS